MVVFIAKTKIIATIGPSSRDLDILKKIIDEGVSCFRINCAHESPDVWRSSVKLIEEASSEADRVVSVMFDIPGPQVRTGVLPAKKLVRGEVVVLKHAVESAGECVPIPSPYFFKNLSIGDVVVLGDGDASLKVSSISTSEAECVATNDGFVKPRQRVVIFGKELDLPYLSERDVEAIKTAVEMNVSFIALSYVRRGGDIELVRSYLERIGGEQELIAKIETKSSVSNIDDIVKRTFSVIIARGDLGLYYPLDEIPIVQKFIASKALQHGKASIVATEVLESMVNSPRPSRSDIVDVYNSVYNLVDAIMLTNETAVGKYPVEAVKWAKRAIESAERSLDKAVLLEARGVFKEEDLLEKYVKGLILLAESLDGVVLTYTKTGKVPSIMFKYRPQVPVYISSPSDKILKNLTITYGIKPVKLASYTSYTYEEGVEKLLEHLKSRNLVKTGDVVIKSYAKPRESVHEIRIEQLY